MLLLLYTGVEGGPARLCAARGDTQVCFLVPGSWDVSRTRAMQRAMGSFGECLPAPCRAAVLVPQGKEQSTRLGLK